jgi:hypothetical protein
MPTTPPPRSWPGQEFANYFSLLVRLAVYKCGDNGAAIGAFLAAQESALAGRRALVSSADKFLSALLLFLRRKGGNNAMLARVRQVQCITCAWEKLCVLLLPFPGRKEIWRWLLRQIRGRERDTLGWRCGLGFGLGRAR